MLMLFTILSANSKTKHFKGEFIQLNSPYVIFYSYSDSEEKEKNVYLWNSRTNQIDSLFSVEAKVLDDALYFCDQNTIKKRYLYQNNNSKDSVLLRTQFDIENFLIDKNDIFVAEIDSSYEKVNIMYYVDGKCSFRQSVPCHPEEMEGQISKIYSYEDYYVISVQYDLYVFDKNKKTLTMLIDGTPDFSIDQIGNIYYTLNSEDFLVKTLYVSNIKDFNQKHEIIKNSKSIDIYHYIVNGKNRSFSVIDSKLYELESQTLLPVSHIDFSENNNFEVTINQEDGSFVLNY